MLFDVLCSHIQSQLETCLEQRDLQKNPLKIHIHKDVKRREIHVSWGYLSSALKEDVDLDFRLRSMYGYEDKIEGYREYQLDLIERIVDDVMEYLILELNKKSPD